MCLIFEVSRSGYYTWVHRPESKRKHRNKYLLNKIKEIHKKSCERYGSIRITRALSKEGINCGKNRVARFLRQNEIAVKTKKKFKVTAKSNHNYSVAENVLNQNFNVEEPNKVWGRDITYIPTDEGWLYLAAIEDLCHRKIVGWSMDGTMTRQLTLDALRQAVWQQRPSPGLIHHSDQSQQLNMLAMITSRL